MAITTHILDTSVGRPAAGVAVLLERESDGQFEQVGRGTTTDDGRLRDLTSHQALEVGTYRLTFDTDGYFSSRGLEAFYPSVCVTFRVTTAHDHYHVPLLLNPYGYSTYRGS